jgi:hypothetical protein
MVAMHWFIVPSPDGPVSGGTLYNRMLMAALRTAHGPCHWLPLDRAAVALQRSTAEDFYWVDSLYLDHLPALARRVHPGARLGLLAHYLPSLLGGGERIGPQDVSPVEAAALQAASAFLVPSSFMRGVVRRLAGTERPVLCVAPGCLASLSCSMPEPPMRAVMVANLVPGKGVEEFQAGLASQIRKTDVLELSIVGSARHDPRYAKRCRALAQDARLRGRVRFLGELSPEQTQAHMAASNLLVSASTMESYGMALAEARTAGVPILARLGGHVATLVGGDWGGELFTTTADLVAACLMLCRTPTEHRRRMQLARARALPARPWSLAASEFTAQLAKLVRPEVRPQAKPANREGVHSVG